MLLKIILILSLALSFGEAIQINSHWHFVRLHQNTPTFTIEYEEEEIKEDGDWIAIYKADSSTAWENVLHWAWIKDLFLDSPDSGSLRFSSTHLDEAGEYQIRFFKRNSYTVEKTFNFTIQEPFIKELSVTSYNPQTDYLSVLITAGGLHFPITPKDWMALYKTEDSNEWENIIQWTWISELQKNRSFSDIVVKWKVETPILLGGDYEIRYFLNNEYTTHLKTLPFHIHEDEAPSNEPFIDTNSLYTSQIRKHIDVYVYNLSRNKKDWIGIFNKDAEKNINNILGWSYNSQEIKDGIIKIATSNKIFTGKEYDIVLFSNDSYNILSSKRVKILDDYEFF